MISTRRLVLGAEYQEKTRMRIIRGPVGVVAMWSSTLSSLIFCRIRAHDYYDYFDDLVSLALLFWDDVVSSEIV
jgi:hypothetical protein